MHGGVDMAWECMANHTIYPLNQQLLQLAIATILINHLHKINLFFTYKAAKMCNPHVILTNLTLLKEH